MTGGVETPWRQTLEITYQLLNDLEQLVELVHDLSDKEFGKAIPPIYKKVDDLSTLGICGSEQEQILILRRITTLRKKLKVMGSLMDGAIERRVEMLAELSGNQALVTFTAASPYPPEDFELTWMSVGDKKLRNHRLILTEDNASLLPLDCLEHRVTDPGFRIQFQLVHRVLVDGPTIIISSYWDKIARLYLVNTCDLNGLVMCLETFTGKKCQRF